MRFYFFCILCLIVTGTCSSQIKKGVVPVGGNINLYLDSDEYGDETFSGWVNPKLAYYVTDRDALGLSLYYYYYRGEVSYDSTKIINKDRRYGFFPFWRRNLLYDDTKGIYLETRFGFERDKLPKTTYLSINFWPGFYYFVTKGFAVETTIGLLQYRHQLVDHGSAGTGTKNSLDLTIGFSSISLGFQYYFNKE
jgi:hypothetical protein